MTVTALMSEIVVGSDDNSATVLTVLVAVGALIPLVVSALSKLSWPNWAKNALNLALSAVAAVVADLVAHWDEFPDLNWKQVVWGALAAWLTSMVAYAKLWKDNPAQVKLAEMGSGCPEGVSAATLHPEDGPKSTRSYVRYEGPGVIGAFTSNSGSGQAAVVPEQSDRANTADTVTFEGSLVAVGVGDGDGEEGFVVPKNVGHEAI